MAKYLVTGGAGFIGTNIVIQLLEQGHSVRVIDNYAGGKMENRIQDGAEYFEGDIRSMEDLNKAMDGIDGVFHLAALPRMSFSIEHPEETNDVNVSGTLKVLIAARDNNVKRIVYSASSSAYGGTEDKEPINEERKSNPKSPYALQKYVGEQYTRLFSELYGLEGVSLRYFNVYGSYMNPEGDYALVVGKFLKQAKEGKPLTICGDGEYYRDYTHVSDVARANILAMTKDTVGSGEVINIGNGNPQSVNTLAKLIGGETVNVPDRPGDMRRSHADNTKAKELLDWEPTVKFEDGIAELKKEMGI
ncbi:MAG: LPS biosynthesis protein WbpP [Candidatus Magasanikbacteria bacterium CG_4_9_14_3_um_filter_32_9]|uniref:LPS biosynthesis protein WbpP n=1 Tax=Candidatus Magasanikbacteria bacterium CG_4_9_14_3_um_filter_32_9 TaxID=1974644 RepID=A0A2M7Z6V1_9BACT|nr:MAG: LPS biosynthesis protein WbpP [Candidatus Magasanikbacteria bacterium CG_4_9_14_3_um_filter_32_9]